MNPFVLLLFFQAAQPQPAREPAPATRLEELVSAVERSGRVLALVRDAEDRLRIAPGAPPLLAFRYLEGRERGRFSGLDLVLDDAGH